MLLPQSSAFAALKNRLNSVSAIGYLQMQQPPRAAPATPGVPAFERPNRLKGRGEGDGGLKWSELLEKFRATQERARRAQRAAQMGGDIDTGSTSGVSQLHNDTKRLSIADAHRAPGHNLARPASQNSLRGQGQGSMGSGQGGQGLGHQKTKSGLSNLGRFARDVGARRPKKPS